MSSDVNVFNIMIWLSTMAYAESADMNVIQALAALLQGIQNMPRYIYHLHQRSDLAAGNTWKFDGSPEHCPAQLVTV